MEDDKQQINNISSKSVDVNLVALVSSTYENNLSKYSTHTVQKCFDSIITWNFIYDIYGRSIYKRADALYKK